MEAGSISRATPQRLRYTPTPHLQGTAGPWGALRFPLGHRDLTGEMFRRSAAAVATSREGHRLQRSGQGGDVYLPSYWDGSPASRWNGM
jgi:hypothetical protein